MSEVSARASFTTKAIIIRDFGGERLEVIDADTDRVLTPAEAAREWRSMTQMPRYENVVLPFDLEY